MPEDVGDTGGVVGSGETIEIFSIVVIKYLIRYLAQREVMRP